MHRNEYFLFSNNCWKYAITINNQLYTYILYNNTWLSYSICIVFFFITTEFNALIFFLLCSVRFTFDRFKSRRLHINETNKTKGKTRKDNRKAFLTNTKIEYYLRLFSILNHIQVIIVIQ